MSKDDYWILALCLFVLTMITVHRLEMNAKGVAINCDIADPDYPPAVKESCRILRIKNEQNKKIPANYT